MQAKIVEKYKKKSEKSSSKKIAREKEEVSEEDMPIVGRRRVRPNVLRDFSSDEEDKEREKKSRKLHPKQKKKFLRNYRNTVELNEDMQLCIEELGEADAAEEILKLYEMEHSSKVPLPIVRPGKEFANKGENGSLDTSDTLSGISALVPYYGRLPDDSSENREGGMQPGTSTQTPRASTPVHQLPSSREIEEMVAWALRPTK